ncbi:hypothetical protein HDU67_006460 [Dinochytrium kinnereticum]|nr:hypothetical protein HDU67_006460 [Dinochytrium kinnereticum]
MLMNSLLNALACGCWIVLLMHARLVVAQQNVVNIGVIIPYKSTRCIQLTFTSPLKPIYDRPSRHTIQDPVLNGSARKLLEITQEDINSDPIYRVPNVEFRLLWRDSEGSKGKGVNSAIELATANNMVGLIAEYTSGVTNPVALAMGSFGVYQCSAASTSPELSDKNEYPYFFRTLPSDRYQGAALARFVQFFQWKKVALLTVNTPYGFGIASNFLPEAEKANITILRNEAFTENGLDFRLQIQSIRRSDARIIIVIGYDNDVIVMLREAKRQGIFGPDYVWIGTDGVLTMYNLLNEVDTRGNYTDEDRSNLEGMLFTFPSEKGGKEWDAVNSRYAARNNGEFPKPFSYFFRDCLLTLALGVKRLVTTRGFTIQQVLERRTNVPVSDFINTPFNGSSGPMEFDENADRVPNFILYNVVRNAIVGTISLDSKGVMTPTIPVTFRSGLTIPPKDGIILQRELIEILSPIGISILTLYGLGIIASMVCCVILVLNRGTAPVKQMSLVFLTLKGASYQNVGEFSVSLSVKYLKDPFLFSISFIITLINLIILSTWTYLDRLVPTEMTILNAGFFHYECRSTSLALQNTFTILLMSYNGILLLAAIVLAWVCRNVHSAYRETNFILYAAQNILICSIVVVGLVFGVSGAAFGAVLYLRVSLTWVATTFVMIATIGRVAFVSLFARDSVLKRSSQKGSWGGSSENRGSNRRANGNPEESGEFEVADERVVVNGYGQMELLLAVKDGNRTLAKWEKKKVIYSPTSRSLGILHPDTLIGEMVLVNNTVTIAESISIEDCVEIRFGNKIRILQFTSPVSLEKFLDITTPGLKFMPGVGLQNRKTMLRSIDQGMELQTPSTALTSPVTPQASYLGQPGESRWAPAPGW